MKILVVSTLFYPSTGGVEFYTLDLFSRLKKNYPNLDITVLTLNTENVKKYEEYLGLKIYRIHALKFIKVNPFFRIRELKDLLEKINFKSFDLVITQCRYYFFNILFG